MKAENRLQILDYARSIAILMVILIHSVESVEYSKALNYTISISSIKWGIETILFIIGRIGVPIFIMLSGALMGKKDIGNIKIHFINKVFPLIRVTIIWILIYRVYYFFLNGMNYDILNIKNIVLEVFFINPIIANHLWFMPMIIGIYIMMPFINKLMQHLQTKQLYLFLLLNCFFYSIFPTLNILLKALQVDFFNGDLYTAIDHIFLGGIYLNYYICGYLIINRDSLKNISNLKLIITNILVAIAAIFSQYILYYKKILPGTNFFWYDNLYIYVISVCCFTLIIKQNIKFNPKASNIVYMISKLSFGIYLIHRIFMDFTIKYLNSTSLNTYYQIIIVYLLTLILSYIIIKIISLNRYVSNILINFKG